MNLFSSCLGSVFSPVPRLKQYGISCLGFSTGNYDLEAMSAGTEVDSSLALNDLENSIKSYETDTNLKLKEIDTIKMKAFAVFKKCGKTPQYARLARQWANKQKIVKENNLIILKMETQASTIERNNVSRLGLQALRNGMKTIEGIAASHKAEGGIDEEMSEWDDTLSQANDYNDAVSGIFAADTADTELLMLELDKELSIETNNNIDIKQQQQHQQLTTTPTTITTTTTPLPVLFDAQSLPDASRLLQPLTNGITRKNNNPKRKYLVA